MTKVIDCFTFYNEFKMLDLRLAELETVVDCFVLVEASKTFTGKDKPLFFQENKEKYSTYPIIHVVVDDMPTETDAWGRETHQRNCIQRGIDDLSLNDNDIIILTDVDEIPDAVTIDTLAKTGLNGCAILEMDFYYYNLRCKWEEKWWHPKVANFGKFKEIGQFEIMRKYPSDFLLPHGGWHFSYFGDIDFIRNKIKSFSHQEFNTDEYTNPMKIRRCMDEGINLFHGHRSLIVDPEQNDYLPRHWKMLT